MTDTTHYAVRVTRNTTRSASFQCDPSGRPAGTPTKVQSSDLWTVECACGSSMRVDRDYKLLNVMRQHVKFATEQAAKAVTR